MQRWRGWTPPSAGSVRCAGGRNRPAKCRRSPFKASGSCLIGGGQGAHRRGTKKGPMGDDNDPRAIKTRKTRKLFKGGDPAMFAEGREGQDSPAGGASISLLS